MARRKGRKRGRGSTSGKLGAPTPRITFSWGPVKSYVDESVRRDRDAADRDDRSVEATAK